MKCKLYSNSECGTKDFLFVERNCVHFVFGKRVGQVYKTSQLRKKTLNKI